MKTYKPFGFSELGGRENNEDSVFPDPKQAGTEDRLFMVCDGVGGSTKGEVASKLVCRYFARYFSDNPLRTDDAGFLRQALGFAEEKLSDHQLLYPETKGMSTTLTLLYLGDFSGKALVAWVGDSRIYQIRNGKTIFRSKDHSEVQGLVDMGEITEEEARIHPRKNVILRAISGSEQPTRIDQVLLDGIQENDFFLLCTDGILEQVDDSKLETWFLQHKSPEELKDLVYAECKGRTKDNFSIYIVKIKEAGKSMNPISDTVLPGRKNEQLHEIAGSEDRLHSGSTKAKPTTNRLVYGLLLVFLLVLISGTVYYSKNPDGSPVQRLAGKADGSVPDSRRDAENDWNPGVQPVAPKETSSPETPTGANRPDFDPDDQGKESTGSGDDSASWPDSTGNEAPVFEFEFGWQGKLGYQGKVAYDSAENKLTIRAFGIPEFFGRWRDKMPKVVILLPGDSSRIVDDVEIGDFPPIETEEGREGK